VKAGNGKKAEQPVSGQSQVNICGCGFKEGDGQGREEDGSEKTMSQTPLPRRCPPAKQSQLAQDEKEPMKQLRHRSAFQVCQAQTKQVEHLSRHGKLGVVGKGDVVDATFHPVEFRDCKVIRKAVPLGLERWRNETQKHRQKVQQNEQPNPKPLNHCQIRPSFRKGSDEAFRLAKPDQFGDADSIANSEPDIKGSSVKQSQKPKC